MLERAKEYVFLKIRPEIVHINCVYIESRMPLFLQLDIEDAVESANYSALLPSGR